MSRSKGIARRHYQPTKENELKLHEGDLITGILKINEHWCSGMNEIGETGLFPADYLELVTEPDGYELRRTNTGYVPRLVPKMENNVGMDRQDSVPVAAADPGPEQTGAGGRDTVRKTVPVYRSFPHITRNTQTQHNPSEGVDELSDDDFHPGIGLSSDGRMNLLDTTISTSSPQTHPANRGQTTVPEKQPQRSSVIGSNHHARLSAHPYPESNINDWFGLDSNGFEHYTPEQLELEIMTELRDPDFRITDLNHSYSATYDEGPATAFLCTFLARGQMPRVQRDGLKDFNDGLLIVENLDVPWIEALTRIGVPLAFLLGHVLRKQDGHNSFLGAKVDTLRQMDMRRHFNSDLEIAHWDAEFGDGGLAVQVVGQSPNDKQLRLSKMNRRPNYTRLSFCQLNPRKYIALIDRVMEPSANNPFLGDEPIIPRYLPENSEGPLSLKYNLHMYFRTGLESDKRFLVFKDALTFWWDMAADAFSNNLTLFSQELKYFTFEAINQPQISDFRTLNRDRRYIDQVVTYLNVCVDPEMKVQGPDPKLLHPPEESLLVEAQMKMFQLQAQASKMRQEFNDTFQLLIGVLSVLDSEISKTQAQRSTALTVLAAIYLPFSLATGIYGMNIAEINNHAPRWWAVIALGLGLLLLTLIVVYFVLKDKTSGDRRSMDKTGVWHTNDLEKGSQNAPPLSRFPSRSMR